MTIVQSGGDKRESLNDRRRAATRADIERAAVELFSTKGYQAATVEDIADRAGVSIRTFYRYCSSKEEVLTAPLLAGSRSLAQRIEAHAQLPLGEAAVTGLVDVAELDDAQGMLRTQIALLTSVEALHARWLAAGRHAQQELAPHIRARRPDLDETQSLALAGALIAALTTALETWGQDPGSDLGALARLCVGVLRLD